MRATPALALLLTLLPFAAAQELKFAADRPFDLRHVRVEGKIDLAAKSFAAVATLEMTALRRTGTVRLDAVNLRIDKVTVTRGQPRQSQAVEFATDGQALHVTLAQAAERGEELTLRVEYLCSKPEEGLFFFGPTEAEPDVPYQAWTQGETTSTRHWIPIVDQPNERVTSELIVTAAAGQQVLSNGSKESETQNKDGTVTVHWAQRKGHVPYLITLVVGKFAIEREEWRGRPIEYWVPPERSKDIRRSFGKTKPMLDFFSQKIGVEYPWSKYAQVVVEQFGWGGMENTSATTLNERTLHDERAALDYSSEGLVAHELAHQWFGDLITCKEWAHTWLNEGFATYFEALWEEHHRGRDEFYENLLRKAGSAISGGKKLPIVYNAYENDWDQFDARAYPKGAWVLHMIRRRLGDEVWWKAVHHYVVTNSNRAVETADLRRAIEEVSGQSFGRFFHDWTGRPGHPVVRVTHRWLADQKLMEVRVQQRQKSDAFVFPLRLEYQAGTLVGVDRVVQTKDERFFVPVAVRPTAARVDPEFAVLMELEEKKGRDLWLYQLLDDDSPILRIRAAHHFAKSRRDEDREALVKAIGQEKFWGVQAEIAKALGESGGDISRAVLLKATTLPHAKARKAVVEALGRFRDDSIAADALEGIVTNGDASYYVEAAAIEAWAKLRPAGAVAKLTPVLARDSHNEVVRQAALRGLGLQENGDATKTLLTWARRGRPRACRTAALEGLGTLSAAAVWDEATTKEVVDAVRACLHRLENKRVKRRAAQTLRDLGAAGAPALTALEALVAHDPDAGVRNEAQKAIDKILDGGPARIELKRLREELKKIREAERKNRERLEKLEAKGG